MFDYIKGFLSDKRKTSKGTFLTIEASGIGYMFEVTEKDFSDFSPSEDEKRKFYLSLIHREDLMALYGFSAKETRDIFQILLSVSGVGAKMAIALLNEFDTCDLISLVINGEFKELTRAKGVGPKLAQKIILELKDKLMRTELPRTASTMLSQTPALCDTHAILLSLGYEENEIEGALNKIINSVEDNSNPEEILRKAAAQITFMGVNYYQSCVCEYNPMDGVTPYGTMNTSGVKGSAQEVGIQGIYKNPANPYLMTTDWDWSIDPSGLQFCCREITSRYALPVIISENGLGAFDKKTDENRIHDEYRICYLKEHLKALGDAIEEGCRVLAYCTWSFTDLLSCLNGYQKRYGFVYVDREEEEGGFSGGGGSRDWL